MLKRLLCSALLVCSFGTHANDWQKEFFSSMSNELPASRGVAVDDTGFVHLQAFNKHPWSTGYDFAHLYTFDAQGQVPWIWGLTSIDRKSDCGVYAKSGQRLDCFRTSGYSGDNTRLEMRSRYNSYLVWQTALPSEFELLDASIPTQDEALLVGKLTGPSGDELGVFRIAGYGMIDVLSIAPTCPNAGQRMIISKLRMPKQDGESIRHIKACWNSFGTTELILEEFDAHTSQWTTLSTWDIAYGEQLLRADINAEGKAFALVEHKDGLRELLRTPLYTDQWETLPFPIEGKIVAFLVGPQGLVAASLPTEPEGGSDMLAYASVQPGGVPMTVGWFDLNAYWPTTHGFPKLSDVAPQSFALSSQGALIVVGASLLQPSSQQLWIASRHGHAEIIASLPLAANEIAVDKTYLVGGPNNVATVARTIRRDGMQIGVRVDQYDLPFLP